MNLWTMEFHARGADRAVRSAIEFLADPHALAREHATDAADFRQIDYPFTAGVAIAVVGGLLDAVGYPELGPNVDQCSWLPDDDDDEDDEFEVSA